MLLKNIPTKNPPAYLKILLDLEKRMDRGEFGTDVPIPSEREICLTYKVSRITARRALDELAKSGRIVRIQGKGSFLSATGPKVRAGKIAFVVDGIHSHGVTPIVLGAIEEESHKLGYQVTFFNGEGDFEKNKEITARILDSRFKGVIMDPHQSDQEYERNTELIEALEEKRVPVVLVHKYPFNHPERYSYVVSDDYRGAYMMVEHLIKLGHKDIALMTDQFNSSTFNRIQGYRSGMLQNNLEIKNELIVEIPAPVETSQILQKLLDMKKNRPTAIFAANDLIAFKILRILAEKGVSVPEDMAVVGFDDLPASSMLATPLTTISQQIKQIGYDALKILQHRITGDFNDIIHQVLPVKLIVRESCGARLTTLRGTHQSGS